MLYQDAAYTYRTRVISKHRNSRFAETVWGRHPEGDTWEFMYFLQLSVPLRRMEGPGTYLLLRSNEESNWSDKEGHSYHYGNTVANQTAVVKGAKFLIDRVGHDGRRIFGTGTIGDITEEPGSGKATKTFRAGYGKYRPLRPPRLVTREDESMLSALPGYNVQHSIHRISDQVFEKLNKPATAWIFQAVPSTYNLRGALQDLKFDTWRVSRYGNEIHTGDRVYLWESGKEAGIIGVAEIMEDPA